MYQVRTTYAHPERMGVFPDENGRHTPARVPGHATRPARAYEVNVWWEDIGEESIGAHVLAGHAVRWLVNGSIFSAGVKDGWIAWTKAA